MKEMGLFKLNHKTNTASIEFMEISGFFVPFIHDFMARRLLISIMPSPYSAPRV